MSYLIYLRKSRKDAELANTDEDVLARHEQILIDLANKHGYMIGGIYKEVVSGDSISGRPQMRRLLREVESGIWEGVLVVEVERLARGDTIDQGVVQRAFQYSNTLIVTPTKIYNPADEFDQEYFEFGLFMSRREYKTIKRRMQNGRIAAVKEGKWPYNVAPYGYKRTRLQEEKGWILEFDEKERPVGELMYHLVYYKNYSIQGVRDYLKKHNLKSRSNKPFTESFIRSFLTNPVNDGMVKIGARKVVTKIVDGVPVKTRPKSNDYIMATGRHKPLVTHDIFTGVQKMICTGTPRTPSTFSVKNPFAGLVICSECKTKMQRKPASSNPRTKSGAPYDILMCKTHNCNTVGSSLAVIEREVIHALKEIINGYEAQELPSRFSLLPDKQSLLTNALSSQNTLSEQKEHLHTLLEQGVYSTELFLERSSSLEQKMQDCASLIQNLNAEIAAEIRQEKECQSFIPNCRNLLELYQSLSPKDRNKGLKELIDHIEYKKLTANKKGAVNEATFELTIFTKLPMKL